MHGAPRTCQNVINVTRLPQSGGETPLLFTENETNTQRLFGVDNYTQYVKDAFHRYIVDGKAAGEGVMMGQAMFQGEGG